MSRRAKNRIGFRYCFTCKNEFPLTAEFFHKEMSRASGFAYRCKPCQSAVSARKPKRPTRWADMTSEQKAARKITQKRYWASVPLSKKRVLSYQAIDKKRGLFCDLDVAWYEANIQGRPCYYCGDAESPIGCDRVDNAKGHSRDNVVPACAVCNVARMHQFSLEEMVVLGRTIRQIKATRKSTTQCRVVLEAGKPYV